MSTLTLTWTGFAGRSEGLPAQRARTRVGRLADHAAAEDGV
jgi:hypothetical protein